MSKFKKILFFYFFLSIQHAYASETKLDSTAIQQSVKEYLLTQFPSTETEKIVISVASLDPRIVIKSCNVPLSFFTPKKNKVRNINVKVSCDAPNSWKIYLSAKIEITQAVLVAKRTISKGDTLNEDNVILSYIAINKLRGEKISDTEIIYGAKAKRRITQGKTISKNNICLVCKGDIVTITAASEHFSIKTKGVALSSGNINEQISVKNTRSNKVITPSITAKNQVVINL